jgi:SAM-dependent methyltransferase
MAIPWWMKIGAKLVLSRLPFAYAVWQKLGLFRHGLMDSHDYALRIFRDHAERAGLQGKLQGRTVLELGPGDSISTAVIAAAYGARAILVDSGNFARADVAPYRVLQAALLKENLPCPSIDDCPDVRSILERCGARYLTEGLQSLRQIESGSVDLIFSQAVLEHVRRKDFLATQRECRRILKPGGVCSHRVDLRDHLGGALNNLRFSERVWESEFFARSGFYTNRISFAQMPSLFSEAGFQVELTDVRRWPTFPTPRNRMDRQFRELPDDILLVSGFEVLLR